MKNKGYDRVNMTRSHDVTVIWTFLVVLGEHKPIVSSQPLLFTLVRPATTATTDTCLFLRFWTNLIRPQNKGGRISISSLE